MLSRSILPLPLVLLSLFVAPTTGCGNETKAAPVAPDGVACNGIKSAGTDAELARGANEVGSGGCVVVTRDVVSSLPIIVPAGVKVVGAKGLRPSITAADPAAGSPGVVVLKAGAQLGNLDVLGAPGVGVLVLDADARIFDVKVSGAKNAAMSIVGMNDQHPTVTLDNVTLEKSAYGLIVTNATLHMNGGRVAENGGTSLSSGAGIVGAGGAKLTLEGVTVEKNEGTGVLLDGEKTRAVVQSSHVLENRERGIWAQGLKGTLDAPSLEVRDTEVARNRIVGVGGVQLTGIIIVGGTVVETASAPIPTNLATTELVGDGVGLFGGTTEVKIEKVNFASNERAAGVIDGSEVGIIIVGGTFPDSPGLKFVVQNSTANIQIDAANKSVPAKPLGISAPKISVPAAL